MGQESTTDCPEHVLNGLSRGRRHGGLGLWVVSVEAEHVVSIVAHPEALFDRLDSDAFQPRCTQQVVDQPPVGQAEGPTVVSTRWQGDWGHAGGHPER